jgi:hypothetical protein
VQHEAFGIQESPQRFCPSAQPQEPFWQTPVEQTVLLRFGFGPHTPVPGTHFWHSGQLETLQQMPLTQLADWQSPGPLQVAPRGSSAMHALTMQYAEPTHSVLLKQTVAHAPSLQW